MKPTIRTIALTASGSLLAFVSAAQADQVTVNMDNYPVVETNRQMGVTLKAAGDINMFTHNRNVPPVDDQPVIRMNRDTLYSRAVVNASMGAHVTIPDAGDRYISLMYLDDNHRVYDMVYGPGKHGIPAYSDFMWVLVRIGVESGDAADLAEINALQDMLEINAASDAPFAPIDYDQQSLEQTHAAILEKFAASGILDTEQMFGTEDYTDPDRYLMGSAIGWGGATWKDNIYQFSKFFEGEECQSTTFEDPNNVGGFWSVTVYDKDGFMFDEVANVNSNVATPNDDGTFTVHFGCGDDAVNNIPVKNDTGAWNAAMRHYTPSDAVASGQIKPLPDIAPVK
ncbi:MAG: DUF1254 domain-containing protein [Marinosulfonomonas sp.]